MAKYPVITFVSTSFSKSSATSYSVTGNLTMHGVTKPVTLAVTARPRSTMPGAYAAASRPPRQSIGETLAFFGTSQARVPVSFVGDNIRITIDAELVLQPEPSKGG